MNHCAGYQVSVCEGISDAQLQDIYNDPYINRISHDHRPAKPIDHPLVTYVSALINGQFAGAFMAIRASALELEVHALLKRASVPYSRMLGHCFLNWAFKSYPVLRITALVIEGLEAARNYCLKLGFQYEGFKRDACMQNGVVKGVYILGMTRTQWSMKNEFCG